MKQVGKGHMYDCSDNDRFQDEENGVLLLGWICSIS